MLKYCGKKIDFFPIEESIDKTKVKGLMRQIFKCSIVSRARISFLIIPVWQRFIGEDL